MTFFPHGVAGPGRPHHITGDTTMKQRLLIVLCLAAILFIAAVRPQQGSELCTPNFPFAVAATWTSADAEATALAVGERTYKTIVAAIAAAANASTADGEIEIYTLPYGTNAVRIRAIGITDNGSIVFDVLSGTYDGSIEDCEMSLRGTLTFTVGTQASAHGATYEVARAVALTASSDVASTADWAIASSGAVESIAEALLDMQGDDLLVLVPTTLTADSKVLIKPY